MKTTMTRTKWIVLAAAVTALVLFGSVALAQRSAGIEPADGQTVLVQQTEKPGESSRLGYALDLLGIGTFWVLLVVAHARMFPGDEAGSRKRCVIPIATGSAHGYYFGQDKKN